LKSTSPSPTPSHHLCMVTNVMSMCWVMVNAKEALLLEYFCDCSYLNAKEALLLDFFCDCSYLNAKEALLLEFFCDCSYLNVGDPYGQDWVPPECDVSIRPGWFWHQNQEPKTVETLVDIYFKSIGRNCVMLLNAPPNKTGLLQETDVAMLREFRSTIDHIFSEDMASEAHVSASSTRGSPFCPGQVLTDDLEAYWAPEEGVTAAFLTLDLGSNKTFNLIKLQEAVHLGQRVRRYHVDVMQSGEWEVVAAGTTIGYKKLDRFKQVHSQLVRVYIDDARAAPLLASVGLYLDTRSRLGCDGNATNCVS
jgi:alpha-L-fucosidase